MSTVTHSEKLYIKIVHASVLGMKPEAEQSIYQSENQVVKFGQTSQASLEK